MIESEKAQLDRWLIGLTGLCIGAYLLICAIMNFCGFNLFCNTDMYADTLISRLMWEQKTLFPEGWIFSNQYYVVATPVLAALLYGVMGNVNTATILATEVMTALIFLSFFWMLWAYTKNLLPMLAGSLLLLSSIIAPDLPENRPVQIFFLQASYYACYLITFFVVVGDYARAFQSTKPRPWAWGLSLFLSFALGIQSLRQTVAMVLPILAYEIFLALRRILQRKPLWSETTRGTLIRALGYAGANILGILTIGWIDPLHCSVYGSFQITPLGQIWGRIISLWPAFQVISGLAYTDSLFCMVFSLILIAIVTAAAILWLVNIKKPEGPLEICWLVCLIGLVGTALSTVMTGINIRHIYLFQWYPLVALSAILLLRHLPQWGKRCLVLVICLLSMMNLTHGYTYGVEQTLLNSPTHAGKAFRLVRDYGYKSFATVDQAYADAKQLCDWAMDNGYEYVYGDWYTAPKIAVHSGGKLTAGYWWQDSMYVPNDHLTSQNFYDEEDNAKAIYVFTEQNEAQGLALAAEKGVSMHKVGEFGNYTAYTSPVQLFSHPWE